ncbi:hypothetical protein GKC30_12030 [Pseudodesulfovibrio sp. F-1]|uniref:Lipoprotein n=1 Tax=Pseudodesulfovibrio alkaliphilus TaxID=2661613 RepID=A0A7K1KQI9_9BACT|nr:hypothetical protein [Pseudodesulfovibrio alkaliphilus]MUM78363.1 hypothetical protein [Pseudodesulfovibrio alkaliphilus]
MRIVRNIILTGLWLCLLASAAQAVSVRVFKAGEAGVSPMQLRERAMAEGFAQAVLDESRALIPAELDEARAELLRLYMIDHAKPYVQGYKILSSEAMDAGLILSLDVIIDRTALRGGLRNMGFFTAMAAPQPVNLVVSGDLTQEEGSALVDLMALTGLRRETAGAPVFTLEKGGGGMFMAHLDAASGHWTARGEDLAPVWFELWGRFFTSPEATALRTDMRELSVAGWFSPDAALEFDRVLRGWDSAVQEVQLVELDMQPSGVGASWHLRLVNGERFAMLLGGYLPQRGLSHRLTEVGP